MFQLPVSYESLLSSKGLSLSSLGIDETALKRNDALEAVKILRSASIPVLGGDAYFLELGNISPALANWYTQRRPEESRDDYFQRSWDESETYIKTFPQRESGEPIFSIVVPSSHTLDTVPLLDRSKMTSS